MGVTNSRDLVIKASQGPHKRIYFVGPFGARVSFASQQRRAFNLVWALREAKEWPTVPKPRVAVIGGGIAGATIAAALHLQRCAVRIFESEGTILSLQREAFHRHVHPTINFWPDTLLSWTTEFPFLDWYAAPCTKIAGDMTAWWNDWFDEEIAGAVTNAEFVGFGPCKGECVELKFADGSVEKADMVFVTTGFGPERDLDDPNLRSYWQHDEIDKIVAKVGVKCVVSGTGDGGLIDALRLTYPGFMTDELALKVLYRSDDPQLREDVKMIEAAAQNIANDNARSKYYFEQYTRIAIHLPKGAKAILPELHRKKLPVKLIGPFDQPFDVSSAPIHKIIMAISLHLERIEYLKGKTIRDNDGLYWLQRKGFPNERLIADFIVIRHGATPPIWQFLGKKATERLRDIQRTLGDYLDLNGYDEERYFRHPRLAPGRRSDPNTFAKRRGHLARAILRDRFKVGVRVKGGHYRIVMDELDAEQTQKIFWDLPDKLFGIDVLPADEICGPMDDLVGSDQ